jgi:hypothetical protein
MVVLCVYLRCVFYDLCLFLCAYTVFLQVFFVFLYFLFVLFMCLLCLLL